jgi:hypothetical protein
MSACGPPVSKSVKENENNMVRHTNGKFVTFYLGLTNDARDLSSNETTTASAFASPSVNIVQHNGQVGRPRLSLKSIGLSIST